MEKSKYAENLNILIFEFLRTIDFNLADLYKMFSINKQITLEKHEFVKGCQIFGIITRNNEKIEHIYKNNIMIQR
jgi:hypothetical protein